MTGDDWKRVAVRPDWREADLHDLRLRYSALLLDIHQHRQAMWDKDVHAADRLLWSVLDTERL